MSIFSRSYLNILFPSRCLFFERAVNVTISLYYSKNVVLPFFIKFSLKTSSRKVFHKEGVSKKAAYTGFSIKLKVAGLKKAPVLVHPCEFCDIFKNDYLVVHVGTAAPDIVRYTYVGISSARPTLTK